MIDFFDMEDFSEAPETGEKVLAYGQDRLAVIRFEEAPYSFCWVFDVDDEPIADSDWKPIYFVRLSNFRLVNH